MTSPRCGRRRATASSWWIPCWAARSRTGPKTDGRVGHTPGHRDLDRRGPGSPEMGRAILLLYRSACQPAMAEAGRALEDAAARPGLSLLCLSKRNPPCRSQTTSLDGPTALGTTNELSSAMHTTLRTGMTWADTTLPLGKRPFLGVSEAPLHALTEPPELRAVHSARLMHRTGLRMACPNHPVGQRF